MRATLKAGVDVRLTRADNCSAQSAHGDTNCNGRYTNVSFADFLLDWSNSFPQTNLQYLEGRFHSYMVYVQDDWKLTPNSTVNRGIRYELTTPMWDKRDRQNKDRIHRFTGNSFDSVLPLTNSFSNRATTSRCCAATSFCSPTSFVTSNSSTAYFGPCRTSFQLPCRTAW